MKKLIKSLILVVLLAVVITLLSFVGNILAEAYLSEGKDPPKYELMPWEEEPIYY